MIECVTDAIVLDKKIHREYDGIVSLFTEKFGLIKALASGIYKITSRLSGHLEPLDVVTVRLVKKNRFCITDAFKVSSWVKNFSNLAFARLLEELLAPEQAEPAMWRLFMDKAPMSTMPIKSLLQLAGFDPNGARCELCHLSYPTHFSPVQSLYFCSTCHLQSGVSAFSISG